MSRAIHKLGLPDLQPLTAWLAAAGSRRQELESLLRAAPSSATGRDYTALILQQNVAGKGSAVSRAKLLPQLRERYLLDERVPEFAAFRMILSQESGSAERGLICYLMMARCDRLFRELSLILLRSERRPGRVVAVPAFGESIERVLANHNLHWSQKTVLRVRQHTLSSLKDFGLLSGSRQKAYSPVRPGPSTACFAARLAQLEGLTGLQTLSSRWFALLGLGVTAILTATGERDVELAGQVAERMAAIEGALQVQQEGRGVIDLVGVEPGQGAADQVADIVHPGLQGADPDRREAAQHLRNVRQSQRAKLDILAGGEVRRAMAEFLRNLGKCLQLGAGQAPAGRAQPHHKETGRLLAMEDAVPLHAVQVFLGDLINRSSL